MGKTLLLLLLTVMITKRSVPIHHIDANSTDLFVLDSFVDHQ